MTDKDVQRNVRSSGEEGVQTPTEKHYHSLSEKDNFAFGEGTQEESTKKQSLLSRFRKREKKWNKGASSKKEKDKAKEKQEKAKDNTNS